MRITAVEVFKYDLAYKHGPYAMSQGRTQTSQPSLVAKVSTDDGLAGWSETSMLGRVHLTAFFESERAALPVLAESVLGLDPRNAGVIQSVMAKTLLAGMAAKCAIDTACLDIAGKASGVPVSTLLGGKQQERVKVWESIPLLDPKAIAGHFASTVPKGVSVFQIKVGNDPYEDAERVAALVEAASPGSLIVADANGGWNLQNAIIAAREMAEQRIFLEQPCKSLSNCAEVMRRSNLPMIMDESIGSLEDLINVKIHVGAGGVNIKPSKLGGLTPARLLRDVATELGMMVTIDDTWGGALTTAALSHLAVSAKPDALLATTFFTELAVPHIANAPFRDSEGFGSAPAGAGLGVEVDEKLLGEPLFRIAV